VEFQEWYDLYSRSHGLDPDPLDLRHQYDYEKAFKSGVRKSVGGHLPSTFKGIGHPRRFVEGQDTATGKKGKVENMIRNIQIQLLIEALFEEERRSDGK